MSTDGLTIKRWKRYEIENYLLVPAAIERTLAPANDLFGKEEARKAIEHLRQQFPSGFFNDPLQDGAAVVSVAASKQILPQMFESAGRPMEKSDFFLIASNMKPDEIHPEVVDVLNMIFELLPPEPIADGHGS